MSKFYAVKKGKNPGIYHTWDECKINVNGYPGAVYKSFYTLEEAEEFIGMTNNNEKEFLSETEVSPMKNNSTERAYAYIDGSYNDMRGIYGFGGFIVYQGRTYNLQGSGRDSGMKAMRNVAGEILGCMSAVQRALYLGIKAIDIYYDYAGIEMWATGSWERNKPETKKYFEYMQAAKDKIDIRFVKVKGHSGIEGNETADRLAKEAVGIR